MKTPRGLAASLGAALVLFSFAGSAGAQNVVNPADPQKEAAAQAAASRREAATDEARASRRSDRSADENLRSWELPPLNITPEGAFSLGEEDLVGPHRQPRWTATRRFTTTRVYVRPPGKVEFEYWLRPTFERDEPTEVRQLLELEFGLPHRLQLDLYLRTDYEGDDGEWLSGQQVELRYALADWGVIPGNPTLYLEWVALEQRPDKVEPKILLGGEIAPRWHWGVNLVGELELGGEREYEYQVTGGLSFTVIDEVFSIGAEGVLVAADVAGNRGDYAGAIFLGPSVQWRPFPELTVNVAPLAGIGGHAPDARVFVNVGWEF